VRLIESSIFQSGAGHVQILRTHKMTSEHGYSNENARFTFNIQYPSASPPPQKKREPDVIRPIHYLRQSEI
jgi:hypothetical protein